jgi:hypothetical protein
LQFKTLCKDDGGVYCERCLNYYEKERAMVNLNKMRSSVYRKPKKEELEKINFNMEDNN